MVSQAGSPDVNIFGFLARQSKWKSKENVNHE